MSTETNEKIHIHNESRFASKARPAIVYVGLFFIFLEVSGFRWLLLLKFEACNEIINYSKLIFMDFLGVWALFVGVYNIARTSEKYGFRSKIIKAITANYDNIINDSEFTKRARPAVIYAGLFFIFCEIIGVRWILIYGFNENIIIQETKLLLMDSTKEIFQWFMWLWAILVSEYGCCRTAEKIGSRK